MDAYTIGLVILALALINKIIKALSPAAISVVAVAGVVIAVIGRRKNNGKESRRINRNCKRGVWNQ